VPPGEGRRIGVDRDGDTFFDGDERDLATDPADAFSVPNVCPDDPDCIKCQRTIEKEGWKFGRAKAKHLARCESFKIQGKLPLATDCATEEKTLVRIDSARRLFGVRVANTCGGDDRVCNADPSEHLPAVLGWGPQCPNFEGGSCDTPITDCDSIVDCLECIHDRAVDQAIELYVGDMNLTEPIVNDELNKCQQKIAKESRKFFDKKSKALEKCWDKRLKGNHDDHCPDASAPFGSVPRKTAELIAQLEAKYMDKVCQRCGGVDRQCDDDVHRLNGSTLLGSGANDDLAPSAIGFVASCPAVTIPDGPSCGGPVGTLAELIECAICVSEFKVDCTDSAQVQQFVEYPAVCNP
jgi:hypothetical protein